MKENNRPDLSMKKDVFQLKLEETQKLLEDQHLSSLQKFCDEVNQITNSETLSSIDSLEAGEHEKIYLTINKEPSISIQQNFKSANLQSTNLSYFDEDKLSFSKTQHINDWLVKLDDPKTQTLTPFSDILSKPSCECFNSKMPDSSALSSIVGGATNNTNNSGASVYNLPIFVQDKNVGENSETSTVRTIGFTSGALKRERPSVTESPVFKCSKAWTTPDSPSQEMTLFSEQEEYPELTLEDGTTSALASFVPAATLLVSPSNTQSARPLPKDSRYIKVMAPVQCSDKLRELKDVKDENIKYFSCNKQEFSLFSDNFQATYIPHNSDSKDKKQEMSETSSLSNCDLLGEHKKMEYNIHERNDVRFLKSILKKDSKYEHDYFKALLINQGFKLGKQKAVAIRDSVELTKEKGKGTEIPKTIKKLRWFDETGDTGKNAEENHLLKNRIGISQQWSQPLHIQSKSGVASNMMSVPACAVSSSDRKKPTDDSVSENISTLGESGTDHVPWNSFIPSGYNVAKQAWPPSQKEESKVPSGDSKTPQKCGAKVIRRTRSAKVQPGFIYTNRKGTVIRPQSASKANTFLQTQGKIIVPHPPPKSPSNIRSAKKIQVSQRQSVKPENSLNVTTHDCFNSKHVHPTDPKLNQWNQENDLPSSDVCSDVVTVMPSLPCHSSECQTSAKTNHPNSTQTVVPQDRTLYCTQKCPYYDKGHHPVTAKEPVTLWKRWHNALGQNAKTADSAVTRRKRIVENKQRSLLVQKRQNPGSVGQKYSEQMNNFGQSVQLSLSEAKQTTRGTSNIEEVSDSTSEFLMAENLVKASVPEDEILTVINSKQLQKSDEALNKTQQFTICALSDEEQKILQSLDRLNESLYYIQETICKNPSIKNALQIMPLLSSQPRTNLFPDVGSRLQRKY